jgi:hypothetical protein
MLTPKGAQSAKFGKGRTWQRHIRIERLARLCAVGTYTNDEIAIAMGVTPQTVSNLKMTPEFRAKMIELTTGVISQFDKDLREVESNQIDELASMVPTALLVLRNSLLSKNQAIAFRAAEAVMDRNGALAKVSRVNVSHEDKPNRDRVNNTAADILALLGRVVGQEEGSNAEQLINSFTVSAAAASEQVKAMGENIDEATLAQLDSATEKVQ